MFLREENADFVLLTEAVPNTTQTLKTELANLYPYVHDASRRGSFGIALFSKYPFDEVETINFRSRGRSIYAVVNIGNNLSGIQLLGMHPLPPISKRLATSRDAELAAMHNFVAVSYTHLTLPTTPYV